MTGKYDALASGHTLGINIPRVHTSCVKEATEASVHQSGTLAAKTIKYVQNMLMNMELMLLQR